MSYAGVQVLGWAERVGCVSLSVTVVTVLWMGLILEIYRNSEQLMITYLGFLDPHRQDKSGRGMNLFMFISLGRLVQYICICRALDTVMGQ